MRNKLHCAWMEVICHDKIFQRIKEYIIGVPGFMINLQSAFILVRLQEHMADTRHEDT